MRVKCIHNDFYPNLIGKTGYIEEDKLKENVIFYPDNKDPFYRVWVRKTDIEEMENA